jgi:O-antigen/teichoic acid export membrane protein
MATAIGPQMQTTFRNADYLNFRFLFYLSQIVSLCASFLACVWMEEIYSFLIHNDGLVQSSSIAITMCFAQALLPFYYFSAVSCFVDRKTKQLLWLVFVPSILNIILCLVFVPFFGYKAAVVSAIVSYWSQIIIPFVITYHKEWTIKWLGSRKKLLLLFIISLCLLLLGHYLYQSNIIIKIAVTFATIIFFIILFMNKLRPSLIRI